VKKPKNTTEYIFYMILTIAFVAGLIAFLYSQIRFYKPWVSREEKIKSVANSIGVSPIEVEQMADCVKTVDTDCSIAPMTPGIPITVILGEITSIDGKWRGLTPTVISILPLKGDSTRTGDWGSKIKVDPHANTHSPVSVKLSLAETQISTFQYATISMSIVFPIGSGEEIYTFIESNKEFERRISLLPVSQEEFKMIQTINVDWEDTRAAIILILIMLGFAFVFYVNAKKNR
jgi:hypothetical protein